MEKLYIHSVYIYLNLIYLKPYQAKTKLKLSNQLFLCVSTWWLQKTREDSMYPL